MNKQKISKRDIYTKFIAPAVENLGLYIHMQVPERVIFMEEQIVAKLA